MGSPIVVGSHFFGKPAGGGTRRKRLLACFRSRGIPSLSWIIRFGSGNDVEQGS